MAVNPDDGGVDHRILHVRIIGHRVEHALERTRLNPVPEAFENRVPVAKRRRQIAPRTAGARDPQHSLGEQPGVAAGASGIGRLAETEWLHLGPLWVRQTKAIHGKLLRGV